MDAALETTLKDQAFWGWYLDPPDDEKLPAELRHLRPARPAGNARSAFLDLVLRCSEHSLVLQLALDYWALELGLRVRGTSEVLQLGWWDSARWHPYCLRWEEVDAISAGCDVEEDIAHLLLSPFAGTDAEDRATLEERRKQAAGRLCRVSGADEPTAEKLAACALRESSERDYRWRQDDRLGWVFEGEYPCYSLRNPAHSASDEGLFPFEEMKSLRASLGLDAVGE